MEDAVRVDLKSEIMLKMSSVRCKCRALMEAHPVLQNECGHVICRSEAQWGQMVGDPPPLTFTRHARQAVIPSPEELDTSIERTCARLASLSLCENTAGEQMRVGELFSGSELEEFSERMRELCGSHLDRLRARAPDLQGERVRELATVAHMNRLVGGCWDKRLYQVYGVCHVLVEIHMIEGLLLGPRFTIWGWALSEQRARVLALDLIIERAREAGILDLARSHGIDHAQHCTREKSRKTLWLWTLKNTGEGTIGGTDKGRESKGQGAGKLGSGCPRRLQPPSAFALVKWRSKEMSVPPVIKWRDVFAFNNVVAQSLAKLVGRALRLLLHDMYVTLSSLALPVMVGVRDLVCAVSRTQSRRSHVRPLEADVDDMFWELDKEVCMSAISHALSAAKGTRREKDMVFSLHKGGDKSLDRIGGSTSEEFRVLAEDELLRFVRWDLFENTLVVCGPVILSQGKQGVPIGGHLAAHIADFWAMYAEHLTFSGESKERAQR